MADSAQSETVELASGHRIPIIGFGTWQIVGEDAYRSVRWALDAGYRHLDTATVYRNEQEVGRAIADSGIDRAELFVTTKLPPDNVDRLPELIDESLAALRTDYVDLWLIHWLPRRRLPKLWPAVLAAREAGKARDVGVSNYAVSDIDALVSATGVAPAVNQIRWSPFLHDPIEADELRAHTVVLEGYSPFQASRLDHPVLLEIARDHAVSPAQIVLRWHVDHGIVVIPKSVHRERIIENLDIFGFELSAEELGRIDALSGAS
jgi:2,5-diketo-D-gluconate reductase A